MRRVALLVEDFAHEVFLTALVARIAGELALDVRIDTRSARGGRPRVMAELRAYLRDLDAGRERTPDLLVVATDANCEGRVKRRDNLAGACRAHVELVLYAIPDPHVERWLLVDPHAFRSALGAGCTLPDQKCEKDRYKELLRRAVHGAGVTPVLGGIEWAEDIVAHLDLHRAGQNDAALAALVSDLRTKFNGWRSDDLAQGAARP